MHFYKICLKGVVCIYMMRVVKVTRDVQHSTAQYSTESTEQQAPTSTRNTRSTAQHRNTQNSTASTGSLLSLFGTPIVDAL